MITEFVYHCVYCGKKITTNESFQLVFCSVGCWEKFKELSRKIDSQYGWETWEQRVGE